ncbi:MAG: prolyl oligopeptidase family serine peptidase [Bacteroidales bacterium]|nr:prolyl oligopeptidase family serine peptidase [Bacteroidales bacterium]
MTENNDYIGRTGITGQTRMTPETLLALGRLTDPQLSPDGELVLYGISYNSIEQNRSCRNLFLLRADGSDNWQLTQDGKSISCARWCDGGSKIAFIQDGQIWCAPLLNKGGNYSLGKRVQLSDVPNKVSEFAFSPDGGSLIYVSTVKSGVDTPKDLYPELDKANAFTTEDLMYRHWDHWVKDIPHTFVAKVDLSGQNRITPGSSADILGKVGALYELPIEPFSGLEQLSWSPDSKYIAYSCKKLTGKQYAFSTNTEIYIYNVETQASVVLPLGGGYDTDPAWSPDGRLLCWVSMARDGYEADKSRLMVARINPERLERMTKTIEGAVARPDAMTMDRIFHVNAVDITSDFKYNVGSPVWEDNCHIWFNSLAEGVQGIFCAELSDPEYALAKETTGHTSVLSNDGSWTINRYTDESLWYDFNTPFGVIRGDEGLTLLADRCSMNVPAEFVAVRNGAECTVLTHENDHLLAGLEEPRMEARYIKTVDGKDMLTWFIYPPHFDPSKVYPAIEICLGGPQEANSQVWSYRWCYRLMAEQGYIVALPNRRGTTAFGQEWTEQISGDYIGLNMQDYLVCAKALRAEPYVGKIAACGASYGGYSIYYLCGIHGDAFDCFIAHAGIFNEEHMYMTTEEMWFPNWDNGGTPDEYRYTPDYFGNQPVGPAGDGRTFGGLQQSGSPWSTAPKAVRHYANSPHKLVQNWHTPLLVIHGGSDFRVPVDQGMAAYNAAQMMGVPSKLLIFPEENHWILSPQNALFWHREYFDWLDRWCK